MTFAELDEQVTQAVGTQDSRPRKKLEPRLAQEQLNRWMNAKTALGMIYARPNHQANVWARVTINALHIGRLICENEHMNFMLSIDNATFSIESLHRWEPSMPTTDRAIIEGLQIWCADGDWLFLTEQIAQSRTLSLANPFHR